VSLGGNECARPVLVSACLAGEPCRYNGSAAPHPAVLELVARGLAVPVCPEVLGGLPTPRKPVELRAGRAVEATGADRTEAFLAGARKALGLCRERSCASAVLKARSPSCGCGQVYDGSFSGRLVQGDGLFAALLKAEGVRVCTEEDLPGQGA
jgi:uncharacterized protein YbbK (DUF523 family)